MDEKYKTSRYIKPQDLGRKNIKPKAKEIFAYLYVEGFKKTISHLNVGEIKGGTSNVKYEHISQLEVHYFKYLDKISDEGITENIKKMLIMDYERNKDIKEQNEINQMQVDLAIKNDTLIIDTESLLKVYEKILEGKLTKKTAVDNIANNNGLINVSSIV